MAPQADFPRRIICMTEESVETLFALGKGDLIVGVSAYVVRPPAALKIPKISVFTHANIKKIKSLSPDLILGFSDIQKDIARDLIAEGFNVLISNQRSIEEIFDYILLLGSIIGKRKSARTLVSNIRIHLEKIQEKSSSWSVRPRVYFEEWDEPMICGIRWVSELIEICGGVDLARQRSQNGVLAKDRFMTSQEILQADPDLIFACWCGKKADLTSFSRREGWQNLSAIKNDQVFELEPEIFLQPGPASLLDGGPLLFEKFRQWEENFTKKKS